MLGSKMDLTGLTFNRLTVLGPAQSSSANASRFICRCACGKITITSGSRIKRGQTKSCGCARGIQALRASNGRIVDPGAAIANRAVGMYRWNAKARSLPFDLAMDEALALMSGHCRYCGRPPQRLFKRKGTPGELLCNGIDRLDNTLGYTKENCVPCCRECNMAKGTKTLDEFREFISRVHTHLLREATE